MSKKKIQARSSRKRDAKRERDAGLPGRLSGATPAPAVTVTKHRAQPVTRLVPDMMLAQVGDRIYGRVVCSCCDRQPEVWQAMRRWAGELVPCDMTAEAFERLLPLAGWTVEHGEPVCPTCMEEYRGYQAAYQKQLQLALVG